LDFVPPAGPGRMRDSSSGAVEQKPLSESSGAVEQKPLSEHDDIEALADEVEAGRGPVTLVRPGHSPVVLVSAEEWQRLDELESEESTAWWRRDATDRRDASGESPVTPRTSRAWTKLSSGSASRTCCATAALRDRAGRSLETRCSAAGAAPARSAS
jgi:PHD/YefM family antitoxin component YafN of YafNO toxin-antitoxin module